MTEIEKQIKQYEPLVKTIINKYIYAIPDVLERQDLISVGMFAIWKAIPKYVDDGRAKMETFLYTVVHNALISYVINHKSKIDFVYTDDNNINGTYYENSVYNCNDELFLSTNLSLSIEKLNSIYSVVINHQLKGYSVKRISELECIPEGTVKSRRFRAIKQLKELV